MPNALEVSRWSALLWIAVLPFSTAATEIALAIVLAGLVVAGARGELRNHDRLSGFGRAALWGWVAFLGWVLMSHFMAQDRGEAFRDLPKLYRFTAIWAFALMPRSQRFERRFLWVLLAVTVVLAVQSLWPYFTTPMSRARTPQLHHNTLSQLMASISILFSAVVLYGGEQSRRARLIWAAGAMLAALVLILTFARAAWIAWFFAIALLVLAQLRHRPWALGVLLLGVAAASLLGPVRDRVARMGETDDPEFIRRYDMWAMGREIVDDHPLFGIGPSGVARVYDQYKVGALVDDERRWVHQHNDLVTLAVYNGVPAALLWAGLCLFAFAMGARRWWSDAAPSPLFVGSILSLLVFFLCGMLHDNFYIYRKMFWMLMLWGLLIHSDREPA